MQGEPDPSLLLLTTILPDATSEHSQKSQDLHHRRYLRFAITVERPELFVWRKHNNRSSQVGAARRSLAQKHLIHSVYTFHIRE